MTSWSPAERRKEGAALFSALLIGWFSVLVPFLCNPQFYFNDDEETQFYAYYIDIGHHLRQGQWPGLTLSTFYGGNLIDDWQYAMLNPFSLLTYWIIAPMSNLLLIGLFLATIYLTLITLGGYCLGRLLGLGRILALAAAAAISTNNFLLYIHGFSWFPGLIAFAWFLWAWVAIEGYRHAKTTRSLLGIIVATYLAVTSGYPHAILMLGALVLGYAVEWVVIAQSWRRAGIFLLVSFAALLMTMPFLFPALLSFGWMLRPSGIQNNGFLMPELGSVLNLSSIFLLPRMHLYSGIHPSYPMMYVAWYIMPMLPIIAWDKAAALKRKPALLIFGAIGVFLLFSPEVLGPIRFPLRFLPYVHVAIIFSFLLLISQPGVFRLTWPRLAGTGAILFLQFTSSVTAYPDIMALQFASIILSTMMMVVAVRFVYFKRWLRLEVLLLGSTLIVFGLVHLAAPKNADLANFKTPPRNNANGPSVGHPFQGYELFIGPMVFDSRYDVRMAAQHIYTGVYTVNGYSALKHKGINPLIGADDWFEMPSSGVLHFLLGIEPETGQTVVSLMRANRLLIYRDYVEEALPLLGDDWIPAGQGKYSHAFDRKNPNRQNTTLAYASPGIVTVPGSVVTGEKEELQITGNDNGGKLVFARLWWPGYEAQLEGKPLVTGPLGEIFVKVELPPGARGMLTLQFIPPGFKLGVVFALFGLLLGGIALWLNRRLAPRAA